MALLTVPRRCRAPKIAMPSGLLQITTLLAQLMFEQEHAEQRRQGVAFRQQLQQM
jgi:hypothetical protein